MTAEELGFRLHRLDPGATLRIDEPTLLSAFGATNLSNEVFHRIEIFATEHRCSFAPPEHGRDTPCFEKDDIF